MSETNSVTQNEEEIEYLEPEDDVLRSYINMVYSDDKIIRLDGVIGLRKLLSNEAGPPIKEVVNSGVVHKLLEFMKSQDEPYLQYETAWAVTNICSGATQYVQYVISIDGLETIVKLFDSSSKNVIDQAVWIIGNIAGDSATFRDLCHEYGCMDKLVDAFNNFQDDEKIKKTIIWAISNLSRGKPLPTWKQIHKGIKPLAQIITETSCPETLTDAIWSISYASNLNVHAIINSGCVPSLVKHLEHPYISIVVPALRSLCHVVAGDEKQTDYALKCPHFLSRVFGLANHEKKVVRREALMVISNITAGIPRQIANIIDYPPFMATLKKACSTDLPEVSSEASWALSNLTKEASPHQIAQLIAEYGYLDILKFIINSSNDEIKRIGLAAAINVLKSGNTFEIQNPYIQAFKENGLDKDVEALLDNQFLYEQAEGVMSFLNQLKLENNKTVESQNNPGWEKEQSKQEQEQDDQPINDSNKED